MGHQTPLDLLELPGLSLYLGHQPNLGVPQRHNAPVHLSLLLTHLVNQTVSIDLFSCFL